MFVHRYTIAVVATLLSQFGFIYHAEAGDDRAGVENFLKLLLDEAIVKFVRTFLKLVTCFCCPRLLPGSHVAVCLAIPVEGIVQTLIVTILRSHVVNHAVDIAVLQSQLLGSFIVSIHHELYLHIRIVAEKVRCLMVRPTEKLRVLYCSLLRSAVIYLLKISFSCSAWVLLSTT